MIWGIAAGLVLLFVLARVGTSSRLFRSEESAHAEALARRRDVGTTIYTREMICVLGSDEPALPCRVMRVSGSKLRIVTWAQFPPDAQLQVERGGDCFVCTLANTTSTREGHQYDLRVVASNYMPQSFAAEFVAAIGRRTQSLRHRAVKGFSPELDIAQEPPAAE